MPSTTSRPVKTLPSTSHKASTQATSPHDSRANRSRPDGHGHQPTVACPVQRHSNRILPRARQKKKSGNPFSTQNRTPSPPQPTPDTCTWARHQQHYRHYLAKEIRQCDFRLSERTSRYMTKYNVTKRWAYPLLQHYRRENSVIVTAQHQCAVDDTYLPTCKNYVHCRKVWTGYLPPRSRSSRERHGNRLCQVWT